MYTDSREEIRKKQAKPTKTKEERKIIPEHTLCKTVCRNFWIPMNHVYESYRPSISSLKVILKFVFFFRGKFKS